jgi:hypothetical protein
MAKILDRLADACGLLYLALVVVGFAVLAAPYLPPSLDDPEQVAAHLRTHPAGADLWLGLALEGAGLVALVLLAARLAARIRVADPAGWLPSAAVGLAVAGLAVKLASFAPAVAAVDVHRYEPGTVTALLAVNDAAVDVAWALDGAFVLLLGLGALATGVLPRWLAGWTALAGAAVLIGLAVPPFFDVLQFAFLLWLLAVSGWLLLRGHRALVPADPADRLRA